MQKIERLLRKFMDATSLLSASRYARLPLIPVRVQSIKQQQIQIRLTPVKTVWLVAILLFAFVANAQTFKWGSVAMGGGGFVSSIITNKTERNLMYARTDVGGAYKWDSTTASWNQLLDWVSNKETGYLGVESLAIDPQAPNRLYMLVGTNYFNGGKTAILSSSDYGKTFTINIVTNLFKAHGNGMGRQNGEKLQVDPNNSDILYCGTRENGLFKSTDRGVTWKRLKCLDVTTTPNKNGVSFVTIDPKSGTKGTASQTIYVGISRAGDKNLFVSKDGGNSFSAVAGSPGEFMPQRGVLTSEGGLYLTYANGAGPSPYKEVNEPMNKGGIWKLNTATMELKEITPPNFSKPFGGICIDPTNEQRLVVSTINTYIKQYKAANGKDVFGDRILFTQDGGATWTDPISKGMDFDENGVTWVNGTNMHWVGCVEFDPFNTNKIWLTSGQGIFSCSDVTAPVPLFKFSSTGIEETVPNDLVSIPGGPLVSVISDYDGFIHSDVTKYAPIHNPRMGTTHVISYAGTNPNVMIRLGGNLMYTLDQGKSWGWFPSVPGYQGKVTVTASGTAFIYSPNWMNTTYRTVDRGANWMPCVGLDMPNARPVADLVNDNKIYVYNTDDGNFFASNDGGLTFKEATNIGPGASRIIRVVPGKEGHIWVAANGEGLMRSTNSGSSFKTIKGVSSCSSVGIGMAAPGGAYPSIFIWGVVNGVEGVFMSSDEGKTWIRVNDNAHQYGGTGNGQFVMGDMNIYGRVYMSTVGRGISYADMVK
ncbi:WD40/YVTN/BNR-like repeat-containing protein [Parasediminibacterium sp. JCM 36343]|uniref:WD40/YVTN/BNR-like repeat-containing protein n=1 Tax=Parasediminibacterium sp. JCM 36343 TaxID=3374279 RepID=UPI0039795076